MVNKNHYCIPLKNKKYYILGEATYKIPNITKIQVEKIAMHATPELEVEMRNMNLIGLGETEIKEISMTDNELFIKAYLPRLEFVGIYVFNGKMLILTLKSSGDMHVIQSKLKQKEIL